jgi:DNA polymerase I-like protein with 3'-5' exonuclease and polymerase domains
MLKNVSLQEWRNAVPRAFAAQEAFNLSIPIDRTWRTARRRVLLVLEHVDGEDLKSRRLLTGPSGHWIRAALDLGQDYGSVILKDTAFAVINFNYFKTYSLAQDKQSEASTFAASRVRAFVAKSKATDVIVFGDGAAVALLQQHVQDERRLLMTRGRPAEYKDIWWTHTISLSQAYQGKRDSTDDEAQDTEIDHANLLGFVSRTVGNALARKIVHKFKMNVVVKTVTTIKEFKSLYQRLMACSRVAVDTETSGLGRVVNKLLTVQFAFDSSQGYVIALDHRDATWTVKERSMVERGLRNFFAREFDPLSKDYGIYLLGQNLKFDLTIIRQRFKIHAIQWRVWDLMAGEFALDENGKALLKSRTSGSGKISPYSLEWMCAWYGCDFYHTAVFSKDDRATIEQRRLDEPGLLEYAVADVQSCWHIHDLQHARSQKILVKNKPYTERYHKFVTVQMNSLVQIESHMEHRGDQLDMPWLMKLKDANGPISGVRRELLTEFKKMPNVIAANAALVKREGLPANSIWGESNWIFGHTKPEHKRQLFLTTMELEPLSYSTKGDKNASLDKEFQEHYAKHPEVALFTQLSQLGTLKGTYVDGFYNKLKTDPDMRTDYCLRSSYGFTGTVTGRSNSYDPNLQNIPARGKFAVLIKRMFVAPRGCLTLKMDYSSHEVRMWGIISGDERLCALFMNGRWLRQRFRKTGKAVYKFLMETQGDIHKVNCEFLFQVPAAKVTKEQRNSVKSVVFGAIYGRGANAISNQTGQTPNDIKKLLKKFFSRFIKASAWLQLAKDHSVKHGHMYSPIWRMRNMYTQMYGTDGFRAATERRGCNAPIQGFAADFGHTAAYLYELHIERVVRKFELDRDLRLRAGVNTFVHDAIKTSAPYEYLLVCLQVLQWCATIGGMQFYKNHWGIRFPVEVEIDMDIAAHDETHYKWSWNEGDDVTKDKEDIIGGGLRYCIRAALNDQLEIYPDIDVDAVEKTIWRVRENKPLCAYLDEHYPILSDWSDSTHVDTSSASFKNGLLKLIKEKQ